MGACSSHELEGLEKKLTSLPTPSEFEGAKVRLSHLVMIGDVTPSTAKVWVKVPISGKWELKLQTKPFNIDDSQLQDERMIFVKYLEAEVSLTFCFECDDLKENTTYFYSVSLQGATNVALNSDKSCHFCTAKSNYDSISVAFFSCHDPFSGNNDFEPGAWHSMSKLADDLDLIIGGGDQIYLDSNEPGITDFWVFLRDNQNLFYDQFVDSKGSFREHDFRIYMVQIIRQYYLIYWNDQNMSHIFGRVPSYMIWNDHEIMDGWGSLTLKEKVEVLKLPSLKTGGIPIEDESLLANMVEISFQACAQVYNEFQHCRNPTAKKYLPIQDNPTGFAWDYSYNRGSQYQFYTLDMRGNHDCTAASDRLLGRGQHERMLQWLDTSITKETEAIFITSPVPFVHWSSIVELSVHFMKSLKDDLMDAWSHPSNHVERDKILAAFFYISNLYSIPIVILSGDVHCVSAYTLTDKKKFPNARIINITSSAITRKPCAAQATNAFHAKGYMKTRENDGKGVSRLTNIHCEQNFAKSGVNNFAVVKAERKSISCTFHWVEKSRGKLKQSTVKF
uniref:PhoD-like phosphatase metallophosphatase domain-containing protein n=1 Tax=Eucampia antarctica TaxID=49252 RepID=A0A7S2R0Y2_9STRA|mmetsp:Transcript_12624/g.12229  ORF Transcript_12624/g.12229 Transcript_12624/m.12229 type:complete len:562 (+) Transcript_12624:55-1740(+)